MSIEKRLFPKPEDSFRRRQFRAVKAAVVVGLLVAAALVLVLFLLNSRSPQ
jgi:hypothetical protein